MSKKEPTVDDIREGLRETRESYGIFEGPKKKDPPKLRIEVRPDADGVVPSADDLLKAAADAGWTDDPGEGKAILIPDERGARGYEVFNPLPFAPPIGYEPTPPIEELIAQRVKTALQGLRDDEEIDDEKDVVDFDVPDELPPLSTIYEFAAMDPEAPALPPDTRTPAQRYVDDMEAIEAEKLLRKRHRKEAIAKLQAEDRMYGDPEPDTP